MPTVTASELAKVLDVSKGRISQYVGEGKLEGCYSGEGRGRRFDLAKCADALGRTLDPGQMMGNGSGTAEAIRGLAGSSPATVAPTEPREATLPRADAEADRYQRARADIAETQAVQGRLKLAEMEGRYVLATEVDLQVRRAIASEIAEFETVLRTGAQKVAAEFGLEAPAVRAILTTLWRSHRARRAEVAAAQAEDAAYSEAEAQEAEAV